MSSLHPGDQRLHYEDGSHRWGGGPPDRAGQQTWQSDLRAHMDAHQAEMRAPSQPVPHQRSALRTARVAGGNR
jgi:hypothetical protein